MNIFLFIITYLFFVLIFNFSFKLMRLNAFGKRQHPLASFFVLNIFIFSLPGILFVYFFSEQLFSVNRALFYVSDDTVNIVSFFYFYSIIVLFIVVSLLYRFFNMPSTKQLDIYRQTQSNRIFNFLFFIVILMLQFIYFAIILYKIGIDNIPILALLKGDHQLANILKANILKNETNRIPYITIIMNLTFIFLPLYTLNSFINSKKKRVFFYFIISLLLGISFLTYEGHKAPFFFLMISLVSLLIYYYGVNLFAALILLFSSFILMLFYFISFGLENADFSFAISKFLHRAFVAQNQGMYFIVNMIEPNLNYLLVGFPFLSRFISLPERADALVMEMLYGPSDSAVNMNTYFLGEAYSSMGILGLIISPLIVGLVLFWVIYFYTHFMKHSFSFFFPLLIAVLFFQFPINQRFNTFLYMKDFIVLFIGSYTLYLFYKITFRIKVRSIQK